ncbi:MAG: sulfatase [Betaproteobacteria bacterium HGW-Betaproteobacteria-1]|jgi:phosphoglycerol transferase MdoB-like AlkP superfamily enzyme|nr:MAG: sulfatase [Betaproteobacteria bacterium HGW-Betaproteobacteria-1]
MLNRFWNRLQFSGFYAPLLALYLVALPILSLSRAGLMLWQSERVAATGIWPEMLLQGLRVDIIQLGLLVIIPLLLAPLFFHRQAWSWWRRFTFFWVLACIILLVFMEAATPGFIGEYDTRPNRLFVEYLKYPEEVVPMLWNGFRIHVFGALGMLALTIWAGLRFMRPWLNQPRPVSNWKHWLALPFVVLLVVFSVRSTTDHRPANPAMFALTTDTMVNTLIMNSTWTVFHAVYNLKHEAKSSEIYGEMSEEDAMQQLREMRALLQDHRPLIGDANLPTFTRQTATVHRDKPLNLVIILQESLGATFVESLGGRPVTPELEKLKTQGWWFENLYATGTRSVRGIESVVTGFAPTPAQSVVKLSLSQDHFFTLASLFKSKGYLSEFIYGGEGHFDNMRNFFINNDFDQVVDKNDYANPVFTGSWGVSDEDLFNKTHEQLMKHHENGQPFFTLVFTSTNHSPFEFPDGRIELHEEPKATENNAVKYADYAMGQFFRQAQASPYWKDTVFLVVADHDIRVRGDDLVPVKHFHIPGLILGADIQPRVIKSVASQIDLPTTVISLMGLDTEHPMTGRDFSAEPEGLPGRAMMQYGENYAWMEGEKVVVLRSGKAPTHAVYDRLTKELNPQEPPADAGVMERRALGHVLLPSILYREQDYHMPGDGPAVER